MILAVSNCLTILAGCGDGPGNLAETEGTDLSQGKKARIAGTYSDPEKTPLKKEVKAGEKNEFQLEVTK